LIQLSAAVNYNRPDIPNPPSYWQETAGVSLTLPLYFGDASHHLGAEARSQAQAAEFRAEQTRLNLLRDYGKAREMLASLREQRKLAAEDVKQSQEEARLYYISYKAGRLNFIDVQNANNQALTASVNASRIDAQTLNQIIILKSLSSEEAKRD
jgi:outer membrane protein TolC